jgi:hypothetical protein
MSIESGEKEVQGSKSVEIKCRWSAEGVSREGLSREGVSREGASRGCRAREVFRVNREGVFRLA